MNSNLQRFQQKFSPQVSPNAQVEKKDINGITYPGNATYALKRRMIVPKWWVENILLTLGKKQAWYASFIADHFNKRVYEYFKATSTNMFFMIFLWDELTRQMFAAPDNQISKARIDLTKFLIGTEKQNHSILKKLEENLIKPIKIFDVTQIDETKEALFTKNGYLNIFKKVSLTKDVNGIWLTLHFAQKLSNILGSPDVKSKKHFLKKSFITINPNLFYAMGTRVNLKKTLNGLFLEYNKQNETLDPFHTAFNIEMDKIDSFAPLVASSAKTLYHHGILSISTMPPPMKISDIKKRQKISAENDQSPYVFGWGLSSQSREARNFEHSLSKQLHEIRQKPPAKQLFREPPRDELQKVRTPQPKMPEMPPKQPEIKRPEIPPASYFTQTAQPSFAYAPPVSSPQLPQLQETSNVTSQNPNSSGSEVPAKTAEPTQPETAAKPPFKYMSQPKPNFHTFSERELSIFVTRFYETLNPKQKKMFECERQSMTREQFRSFMIPILQRTHASLTA